MRQIVLLIILTAAFGQGEESKDPRADDFELVKRLHSRAVAASNGSELIDYTASYEIEGKETETHQIEMVAIKGGTFVMGRSDKTREDESPPHRVKVSPFWMGKYEITWDLYEPFMITGTARRSDGSPLKISSDDGDDDIVSKPTSPYTEMNFGMGTQGFPAISMTQHAASKFCQWLSAKTGHFYRLPTEAEWEYACRAGTTGPFSCPTGKIHDYAVCEPNINNPLMVGYAPVGSKNPNPWGLYDMHGNVMEWCLDQYNSLTYRMRPTGRDIIVDPLIRANRIYPRVARGGSWYDAPHDCTSTVRFYSEPDWKVQDPQLPQSIWYHTDAFWLGFRVVRPFHVPSAEEMDNCWNSAHPDRVVNEASEDE
ncbi:MAG: formylglycine-generating enzyme family protein [Verrucomicrobiales bacterium]|nr:formylglycine-generating enzyme family protein [Verrucomicrobiales bacterium]